MKRVFTLVCMLALSSMVLFPGNPNRSNSFDGGSAERDAYTGPVTPNSAFIVTVVSANVGNLRAILGSGHNVYRDAAGNIHVASLEGTAGTYKLFYAGSSDYGVTFDLQTALSDSSPFDDRYPAITFSSDGHCNILFHERSGVISTPYAAVNADPINLNPWSIVPIGGNSPSLWISFAAASPANNLVAGSWCELNSSIPFHPWSGGLSANGGANWSVLPAYPDTTLESWFATPAYPIAVGNDGYMCLGLYVGDWELDSTIITPIEPIGNWLGITESTDYGQTWTTLTNAFGLTRNDYPSSSAWVDGVERTIYWCQGSTWNNIASWQVYNGNVYAIATFHAQDDVDGTFGGVAGVFLGVKPASLGGTWHWAKVSPDPIMTGNHLLGTGGGGDCWYAELSISRDDPNYMVVAYNDRSYSANGDNLFVAVGSDNGGMTFARDSSQIIRIPFNQLGVPDGPHATDFISISPYFDDDILDMVYLEDMGATIYNSSLYYTGIPLWGGDGISDGIEKSKTFTLKQNCPNPFNPTTTIAYTLQKKANVTLRIYNMLGQEVRTLVRNKVHDTKSYTVTWDGKDDIGVSVASGVYLYRLEAGNQVSAKKMVLIK